MIEYPFGQPVRLRASFVNALGAAANPSTVTFQTGLVISSPPPDPTAIAAIFGIDVAVTNPAVGRFEYVLLPTLAGNYTARVVGTGTVQGAQTLKFRVLPDPFA